MRNPPSKSLSRTLHALGAISLLAGSIGHAQELYWVVVPDDLTTEPTAYSLNVDAADPSPSEIKVTLPNEEDTAFLSRALAFSSSRDQLYFSADTPGTKGVTGARSDFITRTGPDGSEVDFVYEAVRASSFFDLAIDDESGYMYHLSERERPGKTGSPERLVLSRTDLDGENLRELVYPGGDFHDTGVLVDESTGRVYFNSESATYSDVFRTDAEGTTPEAVVTNTLGAVNEIAYDPNREVIYWTIKDHYYLKRAKVSGQLPLDAQAVEPIFENRNKEAITDLQFAPGDSPDNDALYFSDPSRNAIIEAALDGTGQSAIASIPASVPEDAGFRMIFAGSTSSGPGPGQSVIASVHDMVGPLEAFPNGGVWFYAYRQGTFFYPLPSNNPGKVFLYDNAIGQWLYTNESVYPWMFYFGGSELPEDWYYLYENSFGNNGYRIWAREDGVLFNDQ